MNMLFRSVLATGILLLAACQEETPRILGQLQSDRIELVAEAAEPITEILFLEGAEVSPGQVLVRLDDRRISISLQETAAELRRLQAVLAEQERGPRQERIASARAAVVSTEAELVNLEQELQRQESLSESGLGVEAELDQAQARKNVGVARLAQLEAQLQELEAGATPEELEQTRQMIARQQAAVARLELEQERLQARAPVAGLLDTLPFEKGERPAPGEVLAVLLAGEQPVARVYIPETLRTGIRVGDQVNLELDGIEGRLAGRVRTISADPAFTPYFALTERERGRLSYVAEIELLETGPATGRLPDGLPVAAFLPGQDGEDE